MKKKIGLMLVLMITVSSLTSSFAATKKTNIVDDISKNITRIVENKVDNIKAAKEMLSDLIKFATSKFSDVKESDWYVNTVSKLVGLGGIDGCSDGTFKPSVEMKKGEFTKLLVASLGYDSVSSNSGHWANNYVKKAESLKILDSNEFASSELDMTITRYEMAKMVTRALELQGESTIQNKNKYAYQIKDYDNIPSKYKDFVLEAYVKGIIAGYPDGTFKGDRGLSRAEASTVVVRILDTDERKLPPTPAESTKPEEDNVKTTELTERDIKRLQSYELNTIWHPNKESALKSYIGFNEYYSRYKENADLAIEIWTPQEYTPNELKGKTFKWYSSSRLIYGTLRGYDGIRGIIQKSENGKTYEADYEIIIANTTDETRLEHSQRLSDWKEVK